MNVELKNVSFIENFSAEIYYVISDVLVAGIFFAFLLLCEFYKWILEASFTDFWF